eukprot:scaffold9600_cov65-Phaeocystis_antarctica.AAC.10
MLAPAIVMREATCILYLSDWGGADATNANADAADGAGSAGGAGGASGAGGCGGGGGGGRPRVVASGAACQDGALVLYLGAEIHDESGSTAASVVEVLPVGGAAGSALARCSPRGHLPLQRPTCWLKAAPLGPRGAPLPHGCRSEAAAALWCLPKCLESPIHCRSPPRRPARYIRQPARAARGAAAHAARHRPDCDDSVDRRRAQCRRARAALPRVVAGLVAIAVWVGVGHRVRRSY